MNYSVDNKLALVFGICTLTISIGVSNYLEMLEDEIYANNTLESSYIALSEPLSVEDYVEVKKQWCIRDKDCRMVAEAVVYEARGEPLEGQYAVAQVIVNRVEHEKYPDTISGVIKQPSQFSYIKDMHKQSKPKKSDWNQAYVVGYDVLNKEVDSVVQDSTHYHAKHVKPFWSSKLEYVVSVGNHHFYEGY